MFFLITSSESHKIIGIYKYQCNKTNTVKIIKRMYRIKTFNERLFEIWDIS